MKKYQGFLKLVTVAFLFTMAAFVTSCKKDDDPYSAEVTQAITGESTQDAQQDEVDDIATTQLNVSDPQGRIAVTQDGRVACAQITGVLSDGVGTLTIDFDHKANGDANPSGCTDTKGNVRKGKITIAVSGGRWFHAGSSIMITLINYSINGVVINGTRTLTNITTNPLIPTWTVQAEHTAVWPDTKTASRTVHKTKAWDIAAGTVTVSQTPGTANAVSGTNRHGTAYTVTIDTPFVFLLSCVATNKIWIPESGSETIAFDNKTVTVDFGSGTCDSSFTVTFQKKTKTITATNDSSGD